MGGYLALLAARALNEAASGAHQGPHSHRARGRLHRGADLGQGAGRSPARDHGEGRVAAAVRLFERADCFTRALIEDGRKHQPSSRISAKAFETARSIAGEAVSIFDFSR